MKKCKFPKKSILILLLAILIPLGALVATAIAATTATTNLTVVKDPSGNNLYTVETVKGVINYSTRYVHSSSAVLSYHTQTFYFTKENTGGNPTSVLNYPIDRNAIKSSDYVEGGFTYAAFSIPQYVVEDAIAYLYGQDYLYDQSKLVDVKLYLSHGFIIKRRSSASAEWEYYDSPVYNSLTGIQNEAEDPYNGAIVTWPSSTYQNFQFYFDCPLKLNVAKYSIIADTDGGGRAEQSHYDAYLNETVTVYAYPDDGYSFAGWEVKKGSISNFDKTSAESSFVMPAGDLILKAKFQKKSLPPVTKAPEPTRKPTDPTPTPAPTSTPIPVATPEPEFHSQTDVIVRHYSTDAGHYIGKMLTLDRSLKANDDYAFGYFANQNGIKDYGEIYSAGPSYSVGTDSSGNEWYFLPSGSNATYVHPKIYGGYVVDSAEVKYITELTFPSTITMSGTSYTVTTIGGGTGTYQQSSYNSNIKPNYVGYGDSDYNSSTGVSYNWDNNKIFGVIGNGAYTSYGNTNSDYVDLYFENSYYFENTTLKYVSIPSTVTKIESYAFWRCQALEQITGGDGVLTIGTSAFASFDTAVAFQMSKGVEYQSTIVEWYYYNCSKSTTITDTISLWRSSIILPRDLILPAFPRLQVIDDSAFYYRSNLSDVFLPNTVQSIGIRAFGYCFLDSITIPNTATTVYDYVETLGTKGKNIKEKTLIITNPGAKAMDYGLKYEDYYDLRAGYSVTYVKNAMPNESYVSNAMLVKQYAEEATAYVNPFYDSDDNYHYDKYFLDKDGGLYYKLNTKEAGCVLPGVAIESLKKCGYVTFAITKSGEVYEVFESTATKLSLPDGAHNFQFVGMNHYNNISASSRRSSFLVYFLNTDGQICILLPDNTVSTVLGGYPIPSKQVKFDRFVVELEGLYYEGNQFIYDDEGDSRYDWKLAPQIVAHAAPDSLYQPNSLMRIAGKYYSSTSMIASCYTIVDEIAAYSTPYFWIHNPSGGTYTDQSGEYREHFHYGDARYQRLSQDYTPYEIYYATDTALCSARFVVADENYSEHFSEKRNGHYEITTLMSGSFGSTADYKITDYQETRISTVEAGGKVYGFVRYWLSSYGWTGRLFTLFDGTIKQTWEMKGNVSNADYAEQHDYRFLYILGSDNNLYAVFDTEINGYQTYAGYNKVVSNVVKVFCKGNNMFVLDTDGGLWAIGSSEYGAMGHSGGYAQNTSSPGIKWVSATKIEVKGDYCSNCGSYDELTFRDVYMGTLSYSSSETPTYTLIESTCGRVFAAGYDYGIYGDSEDHTTFAPASSGMPAVNSQTYRTGYVYEEPLYDNMFTDTGTEFLGWTMQADGTGTVYQPGHVLRITAPTTVYAKWDGEAKKKIQYIANGGVGTMSADEYPASQQGSVALKKNAFTRRGYEFVGWSYKANPGSSDYIYGDGALIALSPGTTKLYAQWKPFTYTVKVGSDDVRVENQRFETYTMQPDTELTLGTMADRILTVNYNLNGIREGQTSMRKQPEYVTELTDENRKASLAFYGWSLYEDTDGDGRITDEDMYIGRYRPGTVVKNLTSQKDVTLYFFPYWGGSASYVKLPEIVCEGYALIGFTPGYGFEPGAFAEKKDRLEAVANQVLVAAPNGSGARYQPKADGEVLYAYYERNMRETEVTLDGRGATTQEQTRVTMMYGESGEDVIIPKKTGYTFGGYYTGIRGSGKNYFDSAGRCVTEWEETTVTVLYAYWIQNPVEVPKTEEPEAPEQMPEDRLLIEVQSDKAEVHLYADDGNPETGAESDVPPYQVEDVVVNRILQTAGGIPSTEDVAIRAKTGNWLLSCVLERKSGVEQVRVPVTVTYRTQYEDADSEELIISDLQTETIECTIPKVWSYWALAEGGLYLPEAVEVRNDALEKMQATVPVTWDGEGSVEKPSYALVAYGEKENHIKWPEYEEDGTPVLRLVLAEEEYIVSDVPGQLPDVTGYLTKVCLNTAWRDTTQFEVISDRVAVAGRTLLSDLPGEAGKGAAPDGENIRQLQAAIEVTEYWQTYQDAIGLSVNALNGRYETSAEVVYKAVAENAGGVTVKRVPVEKVNEINIHTPVVCIPQIEAYHEELHQCEKIPEGHTVLVLDEEGAYSEFILSVSNFGRHSDKKGYEERDYGEYLAKADGRERNEVCFPFCVWLDTGNDKVTENDRMIKDGEWYTLGREEQRFYLPITAEEGSHEIKFRSVAINGPGNEDKGEERSNTQPAHYVAEGTVKVYVTGRLYGFSVCEVKGTQAWKDAEKEELCYTVGENTPGDIWRTLPLRAGVHPYYRNVGGVPLGGSLRFRLKSVGKSFEEGAMLTIYPMVFLIENDTCQAMDVYYEKEENGKVYLRQWNGRSCALKPDKANMSGEAVLEWEGTFNVPNRFYVTEYGTDVLGYQERHGLTFEEVFWREDAVLILKFACRITNKQGESLYYGMIPETIANNIWKMEAKDSYREDIDGNRFEIEGGEVAVIYPGDSADNEDSTYGIY
ncbi:MAG: leucine-rich repeat protein [Lachnospiraceae bacterium]|nr:leucine-rich repeat protein [Lachnospiraceae bacterium]